jgi:hypothetical protein
MPRYKVPMARQCTEYAWVEVEANSVAEAQLEAFQEAHDNDDIEWEIHFDWPYCYNTTQITEVQHGDS